MPKPEIQLPASAYGRHDALTNALAVVDSFARDAAATPAEKGAAHPDFDPFTCPPIEGDFNGPHGPLPGAGVPGEVCGTCDGAGHEHQQVRPDCGGTGKRPAWPEVRDKARAKWGALGWKNDGETWR